MACAPAAYVEASQAGAAGTFEMLKQKADSTLNTDRFQGWGYLISGSVALAVSIPGYYVSEDVFAKTIYSVTETIGVAAIGYGSYLVLVDNDMSRFVRIVRSVPGLTKSQENQLAYAYLRESADRARNVRRIRVISHGLTAALNLVNAITTSNTNLAEALYFVGGVNTLAAIGFAFGSSDEERALEAQPKPRASMSSRSSMEFFAGPVSGVRFRF